MPTLKKLIEEVECRARENARTMVVGGIDESLEGIEAQMVSASSIIDSMTSERECRSYDLSRPITDKQAARLRAHFDAQYSVWRKAAVLGEAVDAWEKDPSPENERAKDAAKNALETALKTNKRR